LVETVSWLELAESPTAALWARVRRADTALAGWFAVRLDARAARQFEYGQAVAVAPAGAGVGAPGRGRAAGAPGARGGGGGGGGRARDLGGCCMRIARGLAFPRADTRPTAVALGVFDGVHLAHRAILATAVESARAGDLRPVACTFDRHPMEILQPERAPVP